MCIRDRTYIASTDTNMAMATAIFMFYWKKGYTAIEAMKKANKNNAKYGKEYDAELFLFGNKDLTVYSTL